MSKSSQDIEGEIVTEGFKQLQLLNEIESKFVDRAVISSMCTGCSCSGKPSHPIPKSNMKIPIELGGIYTVALWDTGAELSIIKASWLDFLFNSGLFIGPRNIQKYQGPIPTSASNSNISVVAQYSSQDRGNVQNLHFSHFGLSF